jgi:hypothetical protein
MSYHQLQGLASERERELRSLATENRVIRASRSSGLWIGFRSRGEKPEQVSEVAEHSAAVVQLAAPAAAPHADAIAS